MCNKVVNNQIPSPRLGVSLLRENTNIFTNVSYLCILHICVYKIYNSVTLFKGKISYKILVWSQASLLLKELTIFIYFELINVFGIMRSCLLHNDFHSCLFLYSCMLRGSGCHVSCISMYRNICNCPTCATNNLHATIWNQVPMHSFYICQPHGVSGVTLTFKTWFGLRVKLMISFCDIFFCDLKTLCFYLAFL